MAGQERTVREGFPTAVKPGPLAPAMCGKTRYISLPGRAGLLKEWPDLAVGPGTAAWFVTRSELGLEPNEPLGLGCGGPAPEHWFFCVQRHLVAGDLYSIMS